MLIITSNRDEHVSRGIAKFPVNRSSKSGKLTFPQDPLAGGTWVATSAKDVTILLNGGLEKHKHRPPYVKSRGIVVLERFEYDSFKAFSDQYDLEGVEPFTMVNINITSREVTDLVWTGKEKVVRSYPTNAPLIWSSTTLYAKEIRANRAQWYKEWINRQKTSAPEMLEFHQFDHGDSKNGILMDRNNGLKTVSISQIIVQTDEKEPNKFTHNNLLNNTQASTTF
jgi:uncharacterized protein with NRDE domain